jgi:hypothetical protein
MRQQQLRNIVQVTTAQYPNIHDIMYTSLIHRLNNHKNNWPLILTMKYEPTAGR